MKKKAQLISFLISGLFLAALFIWRFIYGGWHDSMWVPIGLAAVFFVIAILQDVSTILEFLTMRTTKHGLNMGLLILITLVFLVTVNFLAVRYEKKFDWTSEGLNSLSDQSAKAAQGLKQDVEFVLMYRKEQQDENIQRNIKDLVAMFQNASKKIKFSAYNALQRPDLAQKYEFTYGPWALYAVQGPRHLKIEQPTEEEVAKTLIKLGREKKKIIYFVMGHGERELDQRRPETASDLKAELEATYEVKPLTLFQNGNKVPDDADAIAIIGPQQQFLDPEIEGLRDFARRGGHLLIALDPGQKHNLALLTKTFGVEFKNNYVLDPRANIPGAGNIAALGTVFSKQDEITRPLPNGSMTVFLLASALQKAPDAPQALKIESIVNTDETAVSANGLEPNSKIEGRGPFALGIAVRGVLPTATTAAPGAADANANKEFSAVIFGDSDFLSNALFLRNLNRDLAVNSFASLAKDNDLISIRPKSPKGTKVEMSTNGLMGVVVVFLGLLVVFFLTGGVMWWRRRTA